MAETQKGAFYGTLAVGYTGSKNRKLLNVAVVGVQLFFPWGIFCSLCYVYAFEMHYRAPSVALILSLVCVVAAVCLMRSGTFMLKLFGMLTLCATVPAMIVGDVIFWHHSMPYYSIRHMATYVGVNPTTVERNGKTIPVRGTRYMDAGTVHFTPDTKVDVSKAVAFKSHNVYCAAPISTGATGGHDFWAVGVNCCGDVSVDFKCGDVSASGTGVREASDENRPFYRMAVLEAEGIHGITSRHPIFFEWTRDPEQNIKSRILHAYALYLISSFTHLVVNSVLLTVAVKRIKRNET